MTELLRNIHSSLALGAATRIVDEAIAARRREGLLPLAMAVHDAGGNLAAFKREDVPWQEGRLPVYVFWLDE